MDTAVHAPLAVWEAFYIIVGSSAGALTGLQFVVVALIADSDARTSSPEIAAFGTPTILHFCAVLLVAALLSAPWPGLRGAGFSLAACGAAGVVYAAVVVRRARRSQGYKPVLEDWIWHALLPSLAYTVLLVAGLSLSRYPETALALVAAVSLLLIFVGIHNAWDAVTYIAIDLRQAPDHKGEQPRRGR